MEIKTLETYLRENIERQTIDHALRARIQDGKVVLYIHPHGVSGDTLDFEVKGNILVQLYANPTL